MKVTRNILASRPKTRLPSPRLLTRIARLVLKHEKIKPSGDVNVVFVDNPKIRKLHKEFLGDKTATDVIAFPYDPGQPESPFGDVYISVDQAAVNAKRFGEPFEEEIIRLVIHGLLHLAGHSDHSPRLKSKMWKVQEKLVRRIKGSL